MESQGSYRSWKTWKVLKFCCGIFQDWSWKVLEICLTQVNYMKCMGRQKGELTLGSWK